MDAQLHYDPEVDIAFVAVEKGRAVGERHAWGLIDRDPEDGHLMGFELWEASKLLPRELIAALPTAGSPTASAA